MNGSSVGAASQQKYRIEDMCRMRPSVSEIMAEIFSSYKFQFGNDDMLPGEVFAGNGFMPVLSHLACLRVHDLFELPMQIEQIENDRAILGVEVNPTFRSLSAMLVYLLNLMQVSYEVFGVVPGNINLDELYEWSLNESMQQKGLPYLGIRN